MKESLLNRELLTRWTELFGDISYLKAKFLSIFGKEKALEDPDFKGLLNTARIIKATVAGEMSDFKELKSVVKRQLYFSTVEVSLFLFAIRHPKAFLKYVSRYLYPGYKKSLEGFIKNEKNKIFLAHNFIGAKMALLCLCAGFLQNGRKLLLYVDEPLFILLKKMFEEILKSTKNEDAKVEAYEDREFVVKGSYLSEYFGNESNDSELCFLNCRKKENFLKAYKAVEKDNYSIALIPEVPIETNRKIKVSFLNKILAFPAGIEMLAGKDASIVSIVPDASDGVLDMRLSVEEIEQNGKSMTQIFQAIVDKYERLAFVNPELFIPFNYFNMWLDLFDKNGEEAILDVLRDRGKCYVLLTNGDVYVGSYKQLQQWI